VGYRGFTLRRSGGLVVTQTPLGFEQCHAAAVTGSATPAGVQTNDHDPHQRPTRNCQRQHPLTRRVTLSSRNRQPLTNITPRSRARDPQKTTMTIDPDTPAKDVHNAAAAAPSPSQQG